MELQIQWLVENKVIHLDTSGDVAAEDFQKLTQSVYTFIEKSDAPLVHLISNETNLGSVPISLKNIIDMIGMSRNPRLGWIINYGADDPIKNYVSTMLGRITKSRHRRFATIEEALTFLVEVTPDLPPIEDLIQSVTDLSSSTNNSEGS